MHSERHNDWVASQRRRAVLINLALAPVWTAAAGVHGMDFQNPRSVAQPAEPIVVFDVNETLLDFTVLAPVFAKVFGNSRVLWEWFNQVIVYSEALTLADEYVDSSRVGNAVLMMLAKARG